MDNSTLPCVSKLYFQINDAIYSFVYYIFTPIYFVVAFSGHILVLIGFVKRTKTEPAYIYQILFTISKVLEILFVTAILTLFQWFSGIESPGALWYQRSHVAMLYAAHLAVPGSNACITTSLLLAVAMSADRVFDLWKPFVYQQTNTKKRAKIIAVVCFVIGWATTIFDCFRFSLRFNGDYYVGETNSAYVNSALANMLANLRNAVRVAGVVALIGCNVAMMYHFRRSAMVKPTLAAAGGGTAAEQKRQADRKATQQTLVTIVISESVLITVTMSLFVSFFMALYASPTFWDCGGMLLAKLMDWMLEVGDVASFLIVAKVDKNVRRTILLAIRCKGDAPTSQATSKNVRVNSINVATH